MDIRLAIAKSREAKHRQATEKAEEEDGRRKRRNDDVQFRYTGAARGNEQNVETAIEDASQLCRQEQTYDRPRIELSDLTVKEPDLTHETPTSAKRRNIGGPDNQNTPSDADTDLPLFIEATQDVPTNAVKRPDNIVKIESSSNSPSGTPSPPEDREAGPIKWAPDRKRIAKRKRPEYVEEKVIATSRTQLRTPDWYSKVNTKAKYSRSDVENLRQLAQLMRRCYDVSDNLASAASQFSKLREHLHNMEFLKCLETQTAGLVIKLSRVLEKGGLPELVSNERNFFPEEIVSDATVLFERWTIGDFNPDLLRGVKSKTGLLRNGTKRRSYQLSSIAEYPYRKPCDVVGSNGLYVGQWWPLRVCAQRDGAHGEQEAGISGKKGKGVFAICMADGGYHDEDYGDRIEYCGTASQNSTPTQHTSFMLDTATKMPGQPIRVLRAASRSRFAPSIGVRYDGLYEIINHELKDPTIAMWRFTLRRLEGQDKIRCGNDETARPTDREKHQWSVMVKFLGNV